MTVLAPTAMKRALLWLDSSMIVYAIQDRDCSNVPRSLLPHIEEVLGSDCEVWVGWFWDYTVGEPDCIGRSRNLVVVGSCCAVQLR